MVLVADLVRVAVPPSRPPHKWLGSTLAGSACSNTWPAKGEGPAPGPVGPDMGANLPGGPPSILARASHRSTARYY